jgi:tetratricopeptide (TPR) repeat protein
MDNLNDVLKAIAANPKRGIFVSRSGAEKQRELAVWIAARLKANGYIPILQDANFKRADFMLAMNAALASGARVLALMSRDYLASEHCMKEALGALDDQLNASRRLVLLRIDDCEPLGLLRRIDRVDFGPVWRSGNAVEMERVLLDALADPLKLSGTFYVPTAIDPAQAIHPQVLMHDAAAFVGRERELADLRELLWNGGTAALTRADAKGLIDEAVLRGMGGIGKTTLARAYAFRHRGDYHAVWWLRAESEETLIEDLIELGARWDPTLARRDDRAAAAREVLGLIADPRRKTNQPWLLVYDNAPGPGALQSWRPPANAHVIVTSRNPAWDKAVPLDVFSLETAVAFLTEAARRTSKADQAEAAVLAEQLGRLPLALAHAASKCRGNRRITFAAYGRRLAEFWRDQPHKSAAHGKYGRSVWATFSIALDDIVAGGPDDAPCPEAETVMGVLAHLEPDEVPEFLLAPLYEGGGAAMTEAALDRALAELTAAGLVAWGKFEDGTSHLGVHRLVQDIMRARLTEQGRVAAIAALATRAIRFSFDWHTGTVAGMLGHGRWLPHASRVLDFAPDVVGDGESWATWIALFIGDHQLSRGSTIAAEASYRRAVAVAERLAQADPGNAGWQRDLSVSHNKFGDVLSARGNLPAALDAFRASHAIAERFARADPEDAGWQRDLSVSHNKIGDVLVEQDHLAAALDAYQASLAIRERLVDADPENAGWQRDLSVSQEKIGDVLRAQGDLPAALDAFQASLAIRERFAKTYPGNAGWQRDLSVSQEKIGDVLRAQDNLPAALDAFRASRAIAERLVAAYPGNAGWQGDLSVSQEKIGDVLVEQGNLLAALDAFQASLAIRDRLARVDPGNAGWQHLVALSFQRIGLVAEQQGHRVEAVAAYRRGLDTMRTLKALAPDHAAFSRDLAWFENRIAALSVPAYPAWLRQLLRRMTGRGD